MILLAAFTRQIKTGIGEPNPVGGRINLALPSGNVALTHGPVNQPFKEARLQDRSRNRAPLRVRAPLHFAHRPVNQ